MRVVSLVPSLTETLLEAGVDVVGRTRFCIHPDDRVDAIEVVGGTKDANWERINQLAPDLVVLDREENTREMADACPVPWFATHVTDLKSVGDELCRLAKALNSARLSALGREWQQVAASPAAVIPDVTRLPGIQALIGEPPERLARIEYVIWRGPWMAAGSGTFIHAVLNHVGCSPWLDETREKYPELDAATLPKPETFYLFSTEPYPFARYVDELAAAGFRGAVVDGEFYSWFGIRSLRLLQMWLQAQQQEQRA